VLTHFIVSDDVARSRRFYTDVLGGESVGAGEPSFVALANSWIIINRGGGPTDDKPTVTLETPPHPDRASSFLNIRVADIEAVYAEWSARGAEFLTPPKQHETEIRYRWRAGRAIPAGDEISEGSTVSTIAPGLAVSASMVRCAASCTWPRGVTCGSSVAGVGRRAGCVGGRRRWRGW
jgi:catechol 2,3-dioxygenase-like lactoylglutathione lyase family enzyme